MKIDNAIGKYIKLFTSIMIAGYAQNTVGVCPMCTLAVGAGVGFARWLGIDNMITGLWVGALILSVSLWTIAFLDRRAINFSYKRSIVLVLYYASVIIPLYYAGFFCKQAGTVGGISTLALGIVLGSLLFMIGTCLSGYLKRKNGGRVFFAYQKLVIPMSLLLLCSFILYAAIKLLHN